MRRTFFFAVATLLASGLALAALPEGAPARTSPRKPHWAANPSSSRSQTR